MAEAQNELSNFLSILGSTGRTVTVEDIDGKTYEVKTVLPAGRQLELAAAIERALDDDTVRSAFDALQTVSKQASGDNVLALIKFGRLLVASDNHANVLGTLDALVKTAHPALPQPASEHFEIQEVLRMLLPFVSRLFRAGSTAGQAGKPAEA